MELPPPPVFDGFEFLEFAVDHQAREELAGLLKTLGFRHAGTHRSKDIHLYRQGGVNLVLDAEQDSAAAEFFHLHGPSVRVMGFRVDDAERAVQRARALLTEGWKERIGPGEREIPAVRGLCFASRPSPHASLAASREREPFRCPWCEPDHRLGVALFRRPGSCVAGEPTAGAVSRTSGPSQEKASLPSNQSCQGLR